MSRRPVCDRCDEIIAEPSTILMDSSLHMVHSVADPPGFLLVSQAGGKNMVVAGMKEPPEGRKAVWIAWREDFDLCIPCVHELIKEVAQRLLSYKDSSVREKAVPFPRGNRS